MKLEIRLLGLLILTLLLSCQNEKSGRKEVVICEDFTPGLVCVGFDSSASLNQIFNKVNSYKTIIGAMYSFHFKSNLPEDSAAYLKACFKKV